MSSHGKYRIALGCLLVAASLTIAAVITLHFLVFSDRAIFQNFSGLKLPRSASVVKSAVTSAGQFGVDTYRCIAFKVDAETIQKWLNAPPLNGAAQWKNGPYDKGVLADTIPSDVLYSDEIHFAVNEYRRGTRGYLVVLEPRSAEAWLLMW
jgi:hypothetical protein